MHASAKPAQKAAWIELKTRQHLNKTGIGVPTLIIHSLSETEFLSVQSTTTLVPEKVSKIACERQADREASVLQRWAYTSYQERCTRRHFIQGNRHYC